MIVDSLDHSGKNLLIADNSSLVIPYIPLNISTKAGGIVVTAVPKPSNLLAPILLNAGSLTFARILNHEMIHIAQSCKGGSINSIPELLGINEKINKEKHILLSSKVYKNLSRYEISLEKEAYSYQDNLSAGKYLINKFC